MTRRIKIGALTGMLLVGLVGTTLVAPSSASAGDAAGAAITGSTKAGYLDRSFVGGKGYRVILKPAGSVSARGMGVAVLPSGLIRTATEHYIPALSGFQDFRQLMRGWTSAGWVDRTFYSGQAKRLGDADYVEGNVYRVTAGPGGTISYAVSGVDDNPAIHRLRQDGRQLLYTTLESAIGRGLDGDLGGSSSWSFLDNGGIALCSTDYLGQSMTYSVTDPDLRPGDERTFPDQGRCGAVAQRGPWIWWPTLTDANAASTLTIERTTTGLAADASWGTNGTTELSPQTVDVNGVTRAWGSTDGSLTMLLSTGRGYAKALARLVPDGSPDLRYGPSGVRPLGGTSVVLQGRDITLSGFNSSACSASAKGLVCAVEVRAAGSKEPWRPRLIRLQTSNGRLDPTFGSGGVVTLSSPVTALTHDPSGRILTLNESSSGTITLARRNG